MITPLKVDFDAIEKSNEEPCKGLCFRGYTNTHWFGDKFRVTNELRLLKKRSCPGCAQCSYLTEELQSNVIVLTPEIEHGKLYELRVTNVSRDYESGIVDDWNVEFCKVREENPSEP